MPPTETPRPLTMAEYAAHWRVCERTVRNWVRRGDVQAIRIGRTVRVLAPTPTPRTPEGR